MKETKPVTGHCLCGEVKLSAAAASQSVGACHCSMCLRWNGGPALAIDCGSDVAFEGEEHIKVYDSSAWAERGFCSNCGTHLFYRLKQGSKHIIPVGLLDSMDGLSFDHQVFIDEKPEFYSFANQTHNMTGAEIFAAFSGAKK